MTCCCGAKRQKGQRWTQFVISFILFTEWMPNGDGSFHQLAKSVFEFLITRFQREQFLTICEKLPISAYTAHLLYLQNNIICTYVTVTLNITLNADQNYIVPTAHRTNDIAHNFYVYNFLFTILYSLTRAMLRKPKHVAVIHKNVLCIWLCSFLYNQTQRRCSILK
jgi:hypothetical protein